MGSNDNMLLARLKLWWHSIRRGHGRVFWIDSVGVYKVACKDCGNIIYGERAPVGYWRENG